MAGSKLIFFVGTLLALAPLSSTTAAEYPNRPVRLIAGFAAGVGLDSVARIVAKKLTTSLGQPVVVENRPGSGGNIAADLVGAAAPDGLTLLFGADSQFVINPHLYPKMTDPLRSLAPVASVASNQFFLAVQPSLPVRDFRDFIELARKSNPPLAYGSAGYGSQSHLGMELLKKAAGIDLLHVPYRSANQAILAAISGEVQVVMSGSATATQIESGKVRGIAVTAPNRIAAFPDLPAVAEFYPDYRVVVWLGLFATAGTPEPIIDRLRRSVAEILADSETVDTLHLLRMEPYPTDPVMFSALIRSDSDRYGKIVKELGITLE